MTLRSTISGILFAATAIIGPAPLLAQITTFIAPPRKAAVESTKTTVAASAAKADTTKRMSLSDMTAWVDSAAGVNTSAQVTVADTAALSVTEPALTAVPTRRSTTRFSNGAIAPNTASPLPFYMATGFVLLFVGLGTLRLARRRA